MRSFPPAPRTPAARAAAAVALLALAVRVAAAWRWAGEAGDDVDMYRALAAGLLAGDGFADPATGVPTAFRPPLVPLIYAALGNAGWAILTFQALAGAATAGLTVRLGTLLGLGWKLAAVAGAVVALDPVLVRYTPRPMTEVTCGLLLAGLLCRLVAARVPRASRRDGTTRSRAAGTRDACGHVLTGVLFGLCVLCRPTVWAFGGLLAAAWVWDRLRGRAGRLHGLGTLAAALLGAAVVVGPWAGRNWAVFGRPIVMTTHGGYTLHLANNARFYYFVVRGPAGAVWGGEGLSYWQSMQREDFYSDVLGAETILLPRNDLPPPGTRGTPEEILGDAESDHWFQRGSVAEVVGPHLVPPPSGPPPNLLFPQLWQRRTEPAVYTEVTVFPPPTPRHELARDRWHRDAAVAFIKSDPAGFARAVPLRVSRLWGPVPLGPAAAGLPRGAWWAVGGWNVAVFLLAAAGVVRVWGRGESRGWNWRAWRVMILLPVAFTVVHAVYWSNARMRGPAMPAVAVLAAAGLAGRFGRDGNGAEMLASQRFGRTPPPRGAAGPALTGPTPRN